MATGFTPGDPDPNNPNLYLVRGKHAHAWPEVFIPGAGWVAFEPTPGRGAPNATDYTGVPESQDSFDRESDATEQAQAAEAGAGELQPTAPTPTPMPPEATQSLTPLGQQPPEEADVEADASQSNVWRNVLLVIALLASWTVGIPALKRWRKRRRATRIGTDPRRRVTLAWATTVDHLESQGLAPFDSETLQEFADRIQRDQPKVHPAFGDLTALAVEASYRSNPPGEDQADSAESLAREIKRTLDATQRWPVRGAMELDPRPLIKLNDPVAELADRLATGAGV